MEWLARISAWIALAFLNSWFTTALVFLAKLLFSLLPESVKQPARDQLMPEIRDLEKPE